MNQAKLEKMIRAQAAKGVTVIFSTHVIAHAERLCEYVGGYAEWIRQRPQVAANVQATKPVAPGTPTRGERKRKLSYKEQQELASLPDVIDAKEVERGGVYAQLADPTFLRDGAAVSTASARLAALDAELTALADRWELLETIATGA